MMAQVWTALKGENKGRVIHMDVVTDIEYTINMSMRTTNTPVLLRNKYINSLN